MKNLFLLLLCVCLSGLLKAQMPTKEQINHTLDSLYARNDNAASKQYLVQIRDLAIRYHSLQSVERAYCEARMGHRYAYLGQFEIADSLFYLAEKVCVDAGKIESAEASDIYLYWAKAKDFGNEMKESLRFAEKSESIRARVYGEKHPITQISRQQTGACLLKLGRVEEGGAVLERCLKIYEESSSTDHYHYARCISELADVRYMQGRLDESEALTIKELQWYRQYRSENKRSYINGLTKLFEINYARDRLQAADSLLRTQLDFYREQNDRLYEAATLLRLNALLAKLELNEESRILLDQLKKLELEYPEVERLSDYIIEAEGDWYYTQYDWENAMKLYQKGADAWFVNQGGPSPEYFRMLTKSFGTQCILGRIDDATATLSILDSLYASFDIEPEIRTLYLQTKSEYYLLLKQEPAIAMQFIDEAFQFEKAHFAGQFVNNQILHKKSNIFIAQKKYDEAIVCFEQIYENRRKYALSMLPLLDEPQRRVIINTIRFDYSPLANFYYHHPSPRSATLLANLALFGKNIGEFTAAKTQAQVRQTQDIEVSKNYTEWLSLREQLNRAYYDTSFTDTEIKDLENNAKMLEVKLAKRGVVTAVGERVTSCSEISKLLNSEEAVIDIFRYQKYGHNQLTDTIVYVFSVIRSETEHPQLVFFMEGAELESFFIGQYHSEIQSKKGLSLNLYQQVWAPVAPLLKGINTVYISPDGIFHKINLGVLPTPNGGNLADLIQINQVTHPGQIKERKSPPEPASGPALAALFGNPNFSLAINEPRAEQANPDGNTYRELIEDEEEYKLTRLPGSEREVRLIHQKLLQKNWNSKVFIGDNALEDSLKNLAPLRVLHIATHGYFLPDSRIKRSTGFISPYAALNPALRSMLFFAGAQSTIDGQKSGVNDGVLTAFEAAILPLEGAELVVLSACNSGQGKILNGEGVIGMQRAFRIAGARTIIMSLWEVEDSATELFMNAFYEHWLGGNTKTEAFKKAQSTLRQRFPQPFYWGSFILVNGD